MSGQSYSKKFLVAGGALLLVFVALYLQHRAMKYGPAKEAQRIIAAEQAADYARAMADTYGGKTPQETLAMYIDAVEKGDYELASKYFIDDYQQQELINLKNSSQAKIATYISLLKDTSKITGGYYERDYMPGGQEFIVDRPIYIRMKLYPNGIWKIVEI